MKEATRFPLIEMHGSHFEMGRQYGTQCQDMIRDLASKFDSIFVRDEKLYEGSHQAMEAAIPIVEASAPWLLEEVHGIADGCGLGFEETFRLSCSAEAGQWRGCMQRRSEVSIRDVKDDECTSFAANTADGTLVAWNMDWYQALLPSMVLLHGKPDDQPDFLSFALVGSVGRPGLSEHIAIGANQLPYRPTAAPPEGGPDWGGPGIPYCCISRMLLAQSSTEDAIEVLNNTRRMCCLNYTIGDEYGDICAVETTPDALSILRPDESFLTHANTFHSPDFQGMPEDERAERDPRAYTSHRLLSEHAENIDRHVIADAQTHHFPGDAGGICIHREFDEWPAITLLSFIGEVGKGRMWAAYGSPCQHEFLEYEL